MKVGDYVRTNDGDIFQITGSDIEFASEIGSDGNLPFNAKIISSEIIDLIEVGDYVNGIKITGVYDDDKFVNDYNLKNQKCLGTNIYDELFEEKLIYEEDIESIVTCEQFESMEYRIG